MLTKLSAKYPDANFWKINTYWLIDKVIHDPSQFPQTKMIKDTTTNCPYYKRNYLKLPSMDYKDPSCPLPVNQYAWVDSRHINYSLHDLVAKVTVDALEA